jgi:caffeyl-CoA reductase-Etf complex subunit CarD
MKILVCAKQVPNSTQVKTNPQTGTIIREGVESVLNPDDANALEAALAIKDANPGTTVTVISMGPPQADEMLRECLAMGADEAILLGDRKFAGSDTWATSNVLAAAIRKVGGYDIVFAGRQATDGDTAQVGPQIAERLGIPQVTYVMECEIKGGKALVKRQLEDGYELIEVGMPCLLTAVKELGTPRYMSVKGIYEAYEKQVVTWGFKDVDVKEDQVGLDASPTHVFRSFTPDPKGKGTVLEGSPKEVVGALMADLKKKHLI